MTMNRLPEPMLVVDDNADGHDRNDCGANGDVAVNDDRCVGGDGKQSLTLAMTTTEGGIIGSAAAAAAAMGKEKEGVEEGNRTPYDVNHHHHGCHSPSLTGVLFASHNGSGGDSTAFRSRGGGGFGLGGIPSVVVRKSVSFDDECLSSSLREKLRVVHYPNVDDESFRYRVAVSAKDNDVDADVVNSSSSSASEKIKKVAQHVLLRQEEMPSMCWERGDDDDDKSDMRQRMSAEAADHEEANERNRAGAVTATTMAKIAALSVTGSRNVRDADGGGTTAGTFPFSQPQRSLLTKVAGPERLHKQTGHRPLMLNNIKNSNSFYPATDLTPPSERGGRTITVPILEAAKASKDLSATTTTRTMGRGPPRSPPATDDLFPTVTSPLSSPLHSRRRRRLDQGLPIFATGHKTTAKKTTTTTSSTASQCCPSPPSPHMRRRAITEQTQDEQCMLEHLVTTFPAIVPGADHHHGYNNDESNNNLVMEGEGKCFVGKEAVDALLCSGYAEDRDKAVRLGRELQRRYHLFHRLSEKENDGGDGGDDFRDEYVLYRFRNNGVDDRVDGVGGTTDDNSSKSSSLCSPVLKSRQVVLVSSPGGTKLTARDLGLASPSATPSPLDGRKKIVLKGAMDKILSNNFGVHINSSSTSSDGGNAGATAASSPSFVSEDMGNVLRKIAKVDLTVKDDGFDGNEDGGERHVSPLGDVILVNERDSPMVEGVKPKLERRVSDPWKSTVQLSPPTPALSVPGSSSFDDGDPYLACSSPPPPPPFMDDGTPSSVASSVPPPPPPQQFLERYDSRLKTMADNIEEDELAMHNLAQALRASVETVPRRFREEDAADYVGAGDVVRNEDEIYYDCFRGREAVDVMVLFLCSQNRECATRLANKLNKRYNLIEPLGGDHDQLEDSDLFYRFKKDWSAMDGPDFSSSTVDGLGEKADKGEVLGLKSLANDANDTGLSDVSVLAGIPKPPPISKSRRIKTTGGLSVHGSFLTSVREVPNEDSFRTIGEGSDSDDEHRRNGPMSSEDPYFGETEDISRVTSSGSDRSGGPINMTLLIDSFRSFVPVQSRTWQLVKYDNCFVGSEAVDILMLMGYAQTREGAVELGRTMAIQHHLFETVSDDGGFFEDAYVFYQFSDNAVLPLTSPTNDAIPPTTPAAQSNGPEEVIHVSAPVSRPPSPVELKKVGPMPRRAVAGIPRLTPPTFARVVSEDKRHVFHQLGMDTADEVLQTIGRVAVKDRRYKLLVYKNCFTGSDLVDLLVRAGHAESRKEAVLIGSIMNERYELFEHVTRDHSFEDEKLFYRFKRTVEDAMSSGIQNDDEGDHQFRFSTIDKSQRYTMTSLWIHLLHKVEVRDRMHRLKVHRSCFVGSELVDILMTRGLAKRRGHAVRTIKVVNSQLDMFQAVGDHEFQDGYYFYRFKSRHNRRDSRGSRASTSSTSSETVDGSNGFGKSVSLTPDLAARGRHILLKVQKGVKATKKRSSKLH